MHSRLSGSIDYNRSLRVKGKEAAHTIMHNPVNPLKLIEALFTDERVDERLPLSMELLRARENIIENRNKWDSSLLSK